MDNSTASSKELPRRVVRRSRSTSAKVQSRNGANPAPFVRRNAIPVLVGIAGMGCLLALLVSQRGKMGGTGGLMNEGLNQVHDAIESARRKMHEAAEASAPKAQALASNVSGTVRRWVGSRFGN